MTSIPGYWLRLAGVALQQQLFERADRLRFAADRAMRTLVRAPGEDVEMRPRTGVLDKPPEKERGGDRAGKTVRRHVVDVGDLGRQPGIVGLPQRHAPQRVGRYAGCIGELRGKPVVG